MIRVSSALCAHGLAGTAQAAGGEASLAPSAAAAAGIQEMVKSWRMQDSQLNKSETLWGFHHLERGFMSNTETPHILSLEFLRARWFHF